jgi:hypothetical protein
MANDMSLKDFQTDLVSGITDEAEKKVMLKLADKLDEPIQRMIDKRVSDTLAKSVNGRVLSDQERKYRNIKHAWNNYGRLPSGEKITYEQVAKADIKRAEDFKAGILKKEQVQLSDGTFFWDNPMLIPKVIADIVREPLELTPMITPLLTQLRFEGPFQSVMFPAVSSSAYGSLDLTEGDPYPEAEMEFGGTVTATMGKVGVMVKFTDETIRFSQWDVMAMHLRMAGTALVRWKEQKCADHLFSQGETYIDNEDPAARHSTGRNAQFYKNGTLSLQDLLTAYTDMMNDGFVPDVLIMHPMAWTIFAQDPTMRAWAYANGGTPWVRGGGQVGAVKQWLVAEGRVGNTVPHDLGQVATTMSPVPGLFPYPLRIMVSPFVPYDSTDSTCSILMADSTEIGILAVNEGIVTEEFRDPLRDINNVKMRERYAIQVLNEGQAIRTFKKIVIARSYDLDDRLQLALTGTVPTGEQFPSFS